jgi:hypothetical protein
MLTLLYFLAFFFGIFIFCVLCVQVCLYPGEDLSNRIPRGEPRPQGSSKQPLYVPTSPTYLSLHM